MMFTASLLFIAFVFFDHYLRIFEGLIFVVLLIVFCIFLIRASRREESCRLHHTNEKGRAVSDPPGRILVFLIAGGLALYYGSEWLIDGAVTLARKWQVSERVISVSMISVGTSIPELAASLIAAFRKQQAISIGNLIGSNIFNILAVLGITAIIRPVELADPRLMQFDIWWMLGMALLLAPFLYLSPGRHIRPWQGGILLIAYIFYVYFVFAP